MIFDHNMQMTPLTVITLLGTHCIKYLGIMTNWFDNPYQASLALLAVATSGNAIQENFDFLKVSTFDNDNVKVSTFDDFDVSKSRFSNVDIANRQSWASCNGTISLLGTSRNFPVVVQSPNFPNKYPTNIW